MAGKPGRKPLIGDKARTEKMILYVTPEMLEDFRILAFIDNQTMLEKFIGLIEKEINERKDALEAFRKIQQGGK